MANLLALCPLKKKAGFAKPQLLFAAKEMSEFGRYIGLLL
jgi:hypothetical protein